MTDKMTENGDEKNIKMTNGSVIIGDAIDCVDNTYAVNMHYQRNQLFNFFCGPTKKKYQDSSCSDHLKTKIWTIL